MYNFSNKERPEEKYNEYKNANLLSKIFVSWIKPFILRSEVKIKTEDLCSLSESEHLQYLKSLLQIKYESMHAESRFRLIRSLFSCFYKQIILVTIICFLSSLLELFVPFLLQGLIDLIVEGNTTLLWSEFLIQAFKYVALIILIKIIVIFMGNYSNYLQNLITINIVVSLNGYIYEKLVYRSRALSKTFTTGEITTLMQFDARSVSLPFYNLLNVFGMVFSLALSFVFLYRFLGNIAIFSILISFFSLIITFISSRCSKTFLRKALKAKSDQLLEASEVLNNVKGIKMYSWIEHFVNKLCLHRNSELQQRRKVFLFLTINSILMQLGPLLVSIGTFSAVAYFTGSISMGTVFGSMSLLRMLSNSMATIPQVFSQLIEANISAKRLEEFINSTIKSEDKLVKVNINDYSLIALEINDCTFAWKSQKYNFENEVSLKRKIYEENHLMEPLLSKKPKSELMYTLKNISLKINKGELVFIIGEVGSGKSSLLSAILGEMAIINSNNQIIVNGRVALVEQTPWIQSMSIEDNISFVSPFNAKKMEETIKICQLEDDLKVLPQGTKTLIGERGINLSGGQKMRVSLARAIYSEADLYLFDDPLGSLDTQVKDQIFENCIASKLAGKTRIIVTHSIEYLCHADRIVVLNNGEITFNGKFNQFLISNTYNSIMNKIKENSYKRNPVGKMTNESHKESDKLNDIIVEEQEEIGKVKCSVYTQYIKLLGGTSFLIICLTFLLLDGGFSTLSDLFIGLWGSENRSSENQSYKFLLFFIISGIISCCFVGVRTYYIFQKSLQLSKNLYRDIVTCVVNAPLTLFLERTPIGRILNVLSIDMRSIDAEMPFVFRRALSIVSRLASITIICILMAIWSFIPLFLVIIIFIFYFNTYVPIRRQMKRIGSKSRSPIVQTFLETYMGISTIRAYNAFDNFINRFSYNIQLHSKISIHDIAINSYFYNRISLVGILGNLMVLIFAIIKTNFWAETLVGLAITYAISIQTSTSDFFRVISEIESTIIALERCLFYTKIDNEGNKINIRTNNIWPLKGDIIFKKFSVKYRPETPLVLSNLNLEIISGQKVGIVGRTGSGKSTLALSILRIIEAYEGDIIIDGQSIYNMDLNMLRNGITIIPQDTCLFIGTLRYNIDPTNSFSDENIYEVIRKTELDHFLHYEGDIMDFKVEEQGKNMSSGERQLICLARALLRNSKILILDEATSSIDLHTEEKLTKIIKSEFKSKTILTIAHRLHTIINSDVILVLDKGSIAEYGSPESLMKNKNSIFAKLINEGHIKTNELQN